LHYGWLERNTKRNNVVEAEVLRIHGEGASCCHDLFEAMLQERDALFVREALDQAVTVDHTLVVSTDPRGLEAAHGYLRVVATWALDETLVHPTGAHAEQVGRHAFGKPEPVGFLPQLRLRLGDGPEQADEENHNGAEDEENLSERACQSPRSQLFRFQFCQRLLQR